MAYIYYNPNPSGKRVGDCVIRGIAMITNQKWQDVYMDICIMGYKMDDMPSANSVWGSYLHSRGFASESLPDNCPMCYTVENFCEDHQSGTYLLATGTHVVAVKDGHYYDAWDSGQEVPVYYWVKKEKEDV